MIAEFRFHRAVGSLSALTALCRKLLAMICLAVDTLVDTNGYHTSAKAMFFLFREVWRSTILRDKRTDKKLLCIDQKVDKI